MNAKTHEWLAQFDHRPVGPVEAAEITQVLEWTAGQLEAIAAVSHDAGEVAELQATVWDIGNAIQIYQQMACNAEQQQQQRFLYALRVQQQAAMMMLQTQIQTSARMNRALQPPLSMPPGYQPYPSPYSYGYPNSTPPYPPRYNPSPYASPYPGTPWYS
ncbi:MAG: hypothetical protein ACYCW6_13640 [Candidatus Xenobia bacterium]